MSIDIFSHSICKFLVFWSVKIVVDLSDANPADRQLARCLANNWEFQPASEAGKPLYGNAYIEMRVDRF